MIPSPMRKLDQWNSYAMQKVMNEYMLNMNKIVDPMKCKRINGARIRAAPINPQSAKKSKIDPGTYIALNNHQTESAPCNNEINTIVHCDFLIMHLCAFVGSGWVI